MKRLFITWLIGAVVYVQGYTQHADSTLLQIPVDSAANAESQEDDFQNALDTLFQAGYFNLDTFAWDNKMINSGHFDSGTWKDTARIVLVDTANLQFFVSPFCNYITCNFGQRRWLWHYGVDIKLQKGDTVRSAFNGIVRVTKYDRRGFGHVVVVRHPNGLETIYGHLSLELVVPNQKLKAGDIIGLGGNSGHSTGSHLHFETRYYGEPLNPNDVIDFEHCKIKNNTLVLTKANFEYLADLRRAKWMKVRKGDTLGHIAIRYHTTVNKLIKLNHIKRTSMLRLGQRLRYQ